MKNNDIYIYGAGGHGKVILDIFLNNKLHVTGFIDDDKKKKGTRIYDFTVSTPEEIVKKKHIEIALAIADNTIRHICYMKLKKKRIPIINAIHSSSVVSKFTTIGEGVVIMANAVINPGTSIGDGVVINTGATIDHDCKLNSFCHIMPGARLAGTVSIGAFSYIGIGSSIIQNLSIGSHTFIGAGAVVINNIPDNVTAVGIPAIIIKKHCYNSK